MPGLRLFCELREGSRIRLKISLDDIVSVPTFLLNVDANKLIIPYLF